ncbi:MAG: pyridoxamine 5'-phosphate oxidase family protein [Alphaproteobacteria bacterium]|nr:pyridoxamine 5'-phosphate oxidase family protein [Alphaproteobacteria bacterium]
MDDDGGAGPGPVADETGLRALFGPASELARLKQLDHLDKHCRNFIAHSPFLVIGTTRPGQGTDVSPRGDAPGFVQVLDDRTLAIPDRPGNNRLDTMSNLTHAPEVGLIFFIPGIDETLRVNGMASLTRDPALLAKAAVNGKLPTLCIKVAVREAFLHCGKALKRSRLWSQDYRVEPKSFPSLGRMIVEQVKPKDVTIEEAERRVADGYKNRLY